MDKDVRLLLYIIAFATGMLLALSHGTAEPTQKDYAVLLLDTAFAEIPK
jgi:hypothetical protein